mgnify:CR=1 FL=1
MTLIDVSHNIKDVERELNRVARDQLPFASAVAITRTAKILDRELSGQLSAELDNPTPYIARATFSTSARKDRLEATIGVRDQASRGASPAQYVQEHFSGDARGMKPYELALQSIGALPRGMRAVPGTGIKLDRFGNPNRRDVQEVIGAMRRGISVFKGKGKRTVLTGYFVRMPQDGRPQARHLAPGIWRRIGMDAVVPVFLFVEQADYRKRFDLPKLARTVIDREFGRELAKSLDQAVRTAR